MCLLLCTYCNERKQVGKTLENDESVSEWETYANHLREGGVEVGKNELTLLKGRGRVASKGLAVLQIPKGGVESGARVKEA